MARSNRLALRCTCSQGMIIGAVRPICHNINNRDFSIPGGQQLFSNRKEEERNEKEKSFPDSLSLAKGV